jgi:hypothetical protein
VETLTGPVVGWRGVAIRALLLVIRTLVLVALYRNCSTLSRVGTIVSAVQGVFFIINGKFFFSFALPSFPSD